MEGFRPGGWPVDLAEGAAAGYRAYLKEHAGEALRLLLEEGEALPQSSSSRILSTAASQLRSHSSGSLPRFFARCRSMQWRITAIRDDVDYRAFLRRFAAPREVAAVDADAFDYGFYSYGLRLYGNMPLPPGALPHSQIPGGSPWRCRR